MGGLAVLALLGLYFFLAAKVFKAAKTTSAKVIALLLILLIPTADAIYGRIKLQQICKAEGGLKVYRVAHGVEGFMGYADEEMITKYGYQFVEECSSPLNCYRFSKQNEDVVKEYNVTAKSKYRLFLKRIGWTNDTYMRNQYIVEELANSETLSTDTQVAFNGGWAERLIALFSDAGGGGVAYCTNVEKYPELRARTLVLNTLKHSGE